MIAPSAITAAAYPLYPEVPVDAGAMTAALAADGAATATNKPASSVPAPAAKTVPAATNPPPPDKK